MAAHTAPNAHLHCLPGPHPCLPAPCPLRSDWRRGRCGGYSVSVLLRELDRRRLVLAREEMVSGKRVCFFRNLAC